MHYNIRDIIPYAVSRLSELCLKSLSTTYSILLAQWWHVKLGKKCAFYGIPLLHKHPTGKISIGGACIFRSAEWSNSIGLNRRCFISASKNAVVEIGANCGFSSTIISAAQSIQIGRHVLCGANCTICDTDRHPVDAMDRASNATAQSAPIEIEDEVWLGMNVTVLKGVKIGRGTIVAANSVVIHSLPPNVLAGGMPARVIGSL